LHQSNGGRASVTREKNRTMKVSNFISPKTGREVPNQFVIRDNGTEWFQSYQSIIGKWEDGTIYLDEYYWDYSKTTIKYRNLWLGLTSQEVKIAINKGEIKLANLN
jgi:hypothetical protein